PFNPAPNNTASSVLNPQVGTTALDGPQAGTDTNACAGFPDVCDRPMYPALFITDVTNSADSRSGDWQFGGTPIAPHAVFGAWQAAVRTVAMTKRPAVITVTPDADPTKNGTNLAGGDPVPANASLQDYVSEVRWSVDKLLQDGKIMKGHMYRMQFMVHDG